MNLYVFAITFLVCIPLIWFILLASRLEEAFKKGKVWQIRAAYVIITLAVSGLLALIMETFVRTFQNL